MINNKFFGNLIKFINDNYGHDLYFTLMSKMNDFESYKFNNTKCIKCNKFLYLDISHRKMLNSTFFFDGYYIAFGSTLLCNELIIKNIIE